MVKSFFKDRNLVILLLVPFLIKIFSLNKTWVEDYYTYGFYPLLSTLLRTLFGWLPFSIGDILYAGAFIYLLIKAWKYMRVLKKRQLSKVLFIALLKKLTKTGLLIYSIFYLFWGLNYNRQGVSKQIALTVKPYTVADLVQVTGLLQRRLNFYAETQDSIQRLSLNKSDTLFLKSVKSFEEATGNYPFLTYRKASIKPSFYSSVGHYFGFTGYYNPFSGEAQVKTSIPVFLKPFVTTHEIAHGIGYAKENEANFVAFLVCKTSADADFRYSLYFELFNYAVWECSRLPDTTIRSDLLKNLHPQVLKDRQELKVYLQQSKNLIEPLMSRFYEQFMKWNNQPKGRRTYNEVIAWLIAYLKKYGTTAI